MSGSVANFGSRVKLGRMAPHFPAGTTYRGPEKGPHVWSRGIKPSRPLYREWISYRVEADGWIKFQRLRTKRPGRLTKIVSGQAS
jgi:hypothetical protein